MTPRILLVGAGGHAKVLLDLLRLSGAEVAGVFDADRRLWGGRLLDAPILGGDDALLANPPDGCRLLVGIGSVDRATMQVRSAVYRRFRARGYGFAVARHPAAVISSHATLEEGAQIMAGAVIQVAARIGANAIVNTRASVDHDCTVGAHSHIAPGAILSGNVALGEEVHVGAGAILKQGVKVGDRAVIGAGALVLADVPADAIALGAPAELVPR